jgi:hypothetical protein
MIERHRLREPLIGEADLPNLTEDTQIKTGQTKETSVPWKDDEDDA